MPWLKKLQSVLIREYRMADLNKFIFKSFNEVDSIPTRIFFAFE